MKKLNLCCGANFLPIVDGWLNCDRDVDITKPLPFANDIIDFILIEHGLEHITPMDGLRFLMEAHRILRPDGVLRVCVPELQRLSIEKGRDIVWGHGHEMVYTIQTLREFLRLAGFEKAVFIQPLSRKDCDGHWKVIGTELDDQETLRIEVVK